MKNNPAAAIQLTLLFRVHAVWAASALLLLAGLTLIESVSAMSSPASRPSGDFAAPSLADWSERSFDGNTHYELVDDAGTSVLKGHTQGQASILYREKTVKLTDNPIISWSWKVDRTYTNIDEMSRDGDDFPARLYVVAQVGFLPWETLALNYVWASNVPVGDSWENPFTDKARMIAIQSGNAMVGDWVSQTRDVEADFKMQFGMDIDEIKGYAVMVDGDNSGKEATAWFGAISFAPR